MPAPAGAGAPVRDRGGSLLVEVEPLGIYRFGGRVPDRVSRHRSGIYERFMHVDGRPILVRAWSQPRSRRVAIAALPAPRAWLPRAGAETATDADLEEAIGRTRHALAVDDDLSDFKRRFRRRPAARPADPAVALAPRPPLPGAPGRRSPGRSPSS